MYGFGRIGRLVARLLVDRTGDGSKLKLRAIVVRKKAVPDLEKRAALLHRDSVHGVFRGTIRIDHARNAIVANGNMVRLL